MEAEVPFDAEAMLHELYSLESIVSAVVAGDWARWAWARAEWRPPGVDHAAAAAQYGAQLGVLNRARHAAVYM